ncbi:glycosyltransferase family 2 protein [Metabacillus halosaccharovorans]|uniref:Glycosyltransferase family 2 protein n=1 Tax=Metabacillus halosaccharovorans TaxID=930124 RepID=A0ABT3DAJ4_9BACI|nr:glycosyltransferase family A protein [Metabacillus halosaccharovorans]MCV9884084.1 glycosyltransferase family 2 protein [Metabacillus halosaccharovorans]
MKISFLSPVYNSEEWIKTMLDSIPKEYAYEIIVCDDGSTDNTLQILEEYKKGCPQLKILINGKNVGAGYSYNRCIAESTGDYIAIIDSDDMYLPPIRDVLAQVDGSYDIYFYNMLTKNGSALIKRETDGYLWPGQFKIIRRNFIGNAKFANTKGISTDGKFHIALIDKNPSCKYTNIFAYWYNYPRKNSQSELNKYIMWGEKPKEPPRPMVSTKMQRRLQQIQRKRMKRRLQHMRRQRGS